MGIASRVMIFAAVFTGGLTVFPALAGSSEITLTDLLPATGKIEGWKRDGDCLLYTAENLWEYIDGSAENFISYGFKEVAVQNYLSAVGNGLKVEIYDHGSAVMAFGIYSQFRGPELTFYEIGNECAGDAYSLHFWKGSYYVRVNVFEETVELKAASEKFARAVADAIKDKGSLPALSACFPEEGLVEKSVMYIAEGVLGRGKFPPAFAAEYRFGDDEGNLYLFSLENRGAAEEIFDWYATIVEAEIEKCKSGSAIYWVGIGLDPYRGKTLIFRYGRWLGVSNGFGESPGVLNAIAEKSVEKIAMLN